MVQREIPLPWPPWTSRSTAFSARVLRSQRELYDLQVAELCPRIVPELRPLLLQPTFCTVWHTVSDKAATLTFPNLA